MWLVWNFLFRQLVLYERVMKLFNSHQRMSERWVAKGLTWCRMLLSTTFDLLLDGGWSNLTRTLEYNESFCHVCFCGKVFSANEVSVYQSVLVHHCCIDNLIWSLQMVKTASVVWKMEQMGKLQWGNLRICFTSKCKPKTNLRVLALFFRL